MPGKRVIDFKEMKLAQNIIDFKIKRNLENQNERVRPKSSQNDKIVSISKCGKPTLLKFETSKPGIEWLANNWRR